jgi:peptide-methionine (S)-S-oxide reductase
VSLTIDAWSFPDPEYDATHEGDRAAVVLAGGCFWCVEAVYTNLQGVLSVRPGYAGGTKETADYKTVCTGKTDHAEVVEVVYDPRQITLGQILKMFFSIAHDPTDVNRQGNDVGRQYRSAIFYADARQKEVAERYIAQVGSLFSKPIATTLEPLVEFFEAEQYHHDYARLNPNQPYIAAVAAPKVEKLKKVYGDKLKGAVSAAAAE